VIFTSHLLPLFAEAEEMNLFLASAGLARLTTTQNQTKLPPFDPHPKIETLCFSFIMQITLLWLRCCSI
jgi:hypothetical protein